MSLITCPEAQLASLQAQAGRVILISDSSQDAKVAEDVRAEIRHSGWECEILQGNVSDRAQIRKLVHDVLDCFHREDELVSDGGRFIRKMTDEEWLAQ